MLRLLLFTVSTALTFGPQPMVGCGGTHDCCLRHPFVGILVCRLLKFLLLVSVSMRCISISIVVGAFAASISVSVSACAASASASLSVTTARAASASTSSTVSTQRRCRCQHALQMRYYSGAAASARQQYVENAHRPILKLISSI